MAVGFRSFTLPNHDPATSGARKVFTRKPNTELSLLEPLATLAMRRTKKKNHAIFVFELVPVVQSVNYILNTSLSHSIEVVAKIHDYPVDHP